MHGWEQRKRAEGFYGRGREQEPVCFDSNCTVVCLLINKAVEKD